MNPQIEPTPKQTEFLTSTARYSCFSGGFGCVAGETKIFDPLTGKHTRIDSIGEGHVFSKTFFGYGVNWATRPAKYKKARLYRVTMELGSSILVTSKHKFLTEDDSWQTVSALSKNQRELFVYGGFHLLTILGLVQSILLSSVLHLKKTLVDLRDHCSTYPYPYDEQPHWGTDTDLKPAPLLNGALQHTQNVELKDDRVVKLADSHLYRSSIPSSRSGSHVPAVPLVEGAVDYIVQKASELPSGSSQGASQYREKTTLSKQVLGFVQSLRGRFWTWYYQNTIRKEKIKSIVYERTDFYYDLHVPNFNNYFAQGFINKNSGKTFSGCLRSLMLSQYPGNVGLIGRQCYDDETEILTEKSGFVKFKDLLIGDKVATLHDGEKLVYEEPMSYYEAPYKGEMISIRNRSFDFLVTPEHKMWVRWPKKRSGGKGDWQKKEAQDIYGSWDWEMKKDAYWEEGGDIDGKDIDYMEFLGFWFAEGIANIYKGRTAIYLTHKDRAYVEDLLQRNNFGYTAYEKGNECFNFRLKVNDETKELCKKLMTCGKAINKSIPSWIKESRREYLRSFIHGFIIGDGHYRRNKRESTQMFTSSKKLADDLQEISFKAGFSCNVSGPKAMNSAKSYKNNGPQYVLTLYESSNFSIEKNHWSKKEYDGHIYCVQVSTGLIYVRRNGKGAWSSNTYIELRDTTRKTFFEVCPPEYFDSANGGRWSPTENHLKLVNGSEILFRHLDTVSEKELLSLNLGWFYIDQAEEISESVFRVLQSRLRLNRVPNRYGFITCNPEPGNWIYNRFQKPLEQGNLDPNFHMINSSTMDNPFNPPDYVDSLLATYPEELVKRFVEGRWDAIEGAVYPEFEKTIHVVKPFTTPKGWEYIVGLDHGMVNPTAALLAALDYDGNIFIIDEYYSPGIVSDHAKAIHKMTANYEVAMWLIDPSTQAKTREKDGGMWSVIEEYEDHGLYFTPANNEKKAGINRVKEFLKPSAARRHPTRNTTPAPRLYIFQNCVSLLEEIYQYKWKKLRGLAQRNLPEETTDYNDHAVDACFIAGTLCLTSRGGVPIEQIRVGDQVWTRKGLRSVSAAFSVGVKKTLTLKLKNGIELTGTPEHPIWVEGKGFAPLQSIGHGDIIRLCTQTNIDEWLEEHGEKKEAKYQKDSISIISTRIRQIIESKTSNVYLHKTIKNYIGNIGRFLIKNAINAVKAMEQKVYCGLDFVQIYANLHGVDRRGLIMSREIALNAKENLLLASTPRQPIARNIAMQGSMFVKSLTSAAANVKTSSKLKQKELSGAPMSVVSVTTAGESKVYNLTVDDPHEYFANGILVHNCRYIVMSRFPPPKKVSTGEDLITRIQRSNARNITSMGEMSDSDVSFGNMESLGIINQNEIF